MLTAAVAWIGLAARDFVHVRGPLRVVLRAVARTIVWSAGAYLAFLLLWGFNYRRVRLVEALPFDAARVTPEAVAQAATIAVDRVNALYEPGRADGGRHRPRSIRRSPTRSIAPSRTSAARTASSPAGRSGHCSTGISSAPASTA